MHWLTAPGEAAAEGGSPAPENATEEVMQDLEGVLMDIADKTGGNIANILFRLLRHVFLDTSLLGIGIELMHQIRGVVNDDATHWLQHLHFEKLTVYDLKEFRVSGVAWFRRSIEFLKHQFAKAGKGYVYYNPLLS
jgi:hypothetical protein